jgi:starvation-inducible DNA-binding protein
MVIEASATEQETRAAIAEMLNETTAELIALTLNCKHAHWNVVGPHFRSLHLHLDEIVDLTRHWADEVAERAVTLGNTADGTVRSVSANANLIDFPTGLLQDTTVVEAVEDMLATVSRRVQERLVEIGDADLVTQDLLIEVAKGLDLQRWMVGAQVKKGRNRLN